MLTRSKSRTTTKGAGALRPGKRSGGSKRFAPVHPGEMLREEFLAPLGLSGHALAVAIQVPATRISEILNERRAITAETAVRLADFFRMTPEFWMNLQARYDLEVARDAMQASGYRGVQPAAVDHDGMLKHSRTA